MAPQEIRISPEQVHAYKMQWQKVVPGRRTENQILIDDLAATFMLSPFGRPCVLFEPSTRTANTALLDQNKFAGLTASRENHQYLASIATHLLDNKFEDFYGISQVIELIGEFDLVAKREGNTTNYSGYYEGSWKTDHPDFNRMRRSLAVYLDTYKTDAAFQKKINAVLQQKKISQQENIFLRMSFRAGGIMVAKYLPEQTPSQAVERLNDQGFRKRMLDYRSSFQKDSVWSDEGKQIMASPSAKIIFERTKRNRYQAGVAIALERRSGKPIDTEMPSYPYFIDSIASAVKQMANECGFTQSDQNFDLLTFTDICLEKMGVVERTTADPHPSDEKMFDHISLSLDEIQTKKKIPDILAKLKKDPIPPRETSWNEETKTIQAHPKAFREFMASGSRIRALTVAALEDIKTAGPLDANELIVARKLARVISPIAIEAGYKSKETNTDMEQVISKVVELMQLPNIAELFAIRAELRNWTNPTRETNQGIVKGKIIEISKRITETPPKRPITESIDTLAKAVAMVLDCPLPDAPSHQRFIEYLKHETLGEIPGPIVNKPDDPISELSFLRMLQNPKLADVIRRRLSQPYKLKDESDLFREALNGKIEYPITQFILSKNNTFIAIMKTIFRENPQLASSYYSRVSGAAKELGLDEQGQVTQAINYSELETVTIRLLDRLVQLRKNVSGSGTTLSNFAEIRKLRLLLSLLYKCNPDISQLKFQTIIRDSKEARVRTDVIVDNPDSNKKASKQSTVFLKSVWMDSQKPDISFPTLEEAI